MVIKVGDTVSIKYGTHNGWDLKGYYGVVKKINGYIYVAVSEPIGLVKCFEDEVFVCNSSGYGDGVSHDGYSFF